MPGSADEHFARAEAFLAEGRPDEAIAAYDAVLELEPARAAALNNRGVALRKLGREEDALVCFDQALAIRSDDPGFLLNRATALGALHRSDEALQTLDRALQLRPDYAEALNAKGAVLQQLGRLADAVISLDRAVALQPDYAVALRNLGDVLARTGNPAPAMEMFSRAYSIAPDTEFLIGNLLMTRLQLCDWNGVEAMRARLGEALASGSRVASPFSALLLFDDPRMHRRAAEAYASARHPSCSDRPPAAVRTGSRIRLGYFSADFRNHPVSYLAAELFELHDRGRFEVHGFNLASPATDPMGRRVASAFDQYHDVQRMDDRSIALQARALGIDIAIDLGGYTEGNRTGVFACRPAPVQVGYLGYLGTMGAPYYDYLIADHVIVPPSHRQHYPERIIRLPSYQVNDRKRRIAEVRPDRAGEGLPENGFVFCCFNNSFKISPKVFSCWMRILARCPGSVLWLYPGCAEAADNLRGEAARAGIDPARLVFAGRLDYDRYLARYALADLFLDTLPYNAGTTASDALWAGVPVLTRMGEGFAGRVAASLLHAAGLADLVTGSADEYVELAVALAHDESRLGEVRRRVAASRHNSALFDTENFVANLETAFIKMQDLSEHGQAPEDIDV